MQVVEVVTRSGGVADAADLVRWTSRRRLRSAVRRGEVVRDRRGRYALPTAEPAARAANALAGVVSHASAASDWGWEMKHPASTPVVTVPRNRKVAAERRDGVDVRWGDLRPDEVRDGRVTASGRTVIDCAKTMPFDEALAVADSAIRHRDMSKTRLCELAEQVPSIGRAACLRVAAEADGRAANPFESVLRAIALDVPGLDLVPQVAIGDGGLVVQPDLVDVRRGIVLEADSFEFHGRREALKRDCERYNALVCRGWIVLRFAWENVMFEPDYVAAALRAVSVARPRRRATLAADDRKSA